MEWVFAIPGDQPQGRVQHCTASRLLRRPLGSCFTGCGKRSDRFSGPVEVDETYFGGREGNKHAHKKQRLGRGGFEKAVVAWGKGPRHRFGSALSEATDAKTLQGFVASHACDRLHWSMEPCCLSMRACAIAASHPGYREFHAETIPQAAVLYATSTSLSTASVDHIPPTRCGLVAGMIGKRLLYRDLVS